MKIGVFDSGIGGRSVALAIEKALPEAQVVFRHDVPGHFPYATKEPTEIFGYVLPILRSLADDGCIVIVVACNTVSTTLIDQLRARISVPLVAIEPMVKPAASLTKSGMIAVCATPTTLRSPRYQKLKQLYAGGITVLEPDCADWSALIEHNQMDAEKLRHELEPALQQGADVIVLGCTHYHWIESEVIKLAAGRAKVLQPEQAITQQLRKVLVRLA